MGHGWVPVIAPALVALAAGQVVAWLLLLVPRFGRRLGPALTSRRLRRDPDPASVVRILVAATVLLAVTLTGGRAAADWRDDASRLRSGGPLVVSVHRRRLPCLRRRPRSRPARPLADGGGLGRRPAAHRPPGLRRRGPLAGGGGRLHGRHERLERHRADERPGRAARPGADAGHVAARARVRVRRPRRCHRRRRGSLRGRRRVPAHDARPGDRRRPRDHAPPAVPRRVLPAVAHRRRRRHLRRTPGGRRHAGPASPPGLVRRGRRPSGWSRSTRARIRQPVRRCRRSPPPT